MAQPVGYNTYAPDSRGPLHVQIEGSWYRLPKVRNVGFTATTPTDTTTEYVDEPTETRSGSSGPGSVTYDLTRAPTMLAYRTVYDAFKDGTSLTFRDFGGTAVEESPASADMVSFSQPSEARIQHVMTIAGASAGTQDSPSAQYRPGKVIAVADVAYTIEQIRTPVSIFVSRLGAVSTNVAGVARAVIPDNVGFPASTAALATTNAFTIHEPGTVRVFSGRVTEMGAYTRGASNEGQVDRMVVNVLSFPSDIITLKISS